MSDERVQRYDAPQRVFHMVNLIGMFILLGTGLTIYNLTFLGYQPFSEFAKAMFGEVYMPLIYDMHILGAFTILGALLFHILYDTGIKGVFWSELPGRADFRGFGIMAKNFLGLSKDYIKFHKYNPGQKITHVMIALVVVLIGATGFIMSANYRWMVPIWWLNLDFDFVLYWARVAHDLLTFTLVTLVLMHFYFSMRKENFTAGKSIITGWIPKSFQEAHYAATEEPELIPAKLRED